MLLPILAAPVISREIPSNDKRMRADYNVRGPTIATHAAPSSGIRATAVAPNVPTTRMKQLRITKWGDPPPRSKQISDTIAVNSTY